jgi:DNA-binding NtrC family response regulator
MHLESNVATILIVEDDTTLGQILARVLTGPRQWAVSVSNPKHALRLVENRWPRLVLLDVCRRDGTALDLAESIRVASPDLPLVLLTAFSQQKPAVPRWINCHVTKSINLSDLRKTIGAELAQGNVTWKSKRCLSPPNPSVAASGRFTKSVNR